MKMTMMQHFAELRRRVLWALLFFTISFGAGWFIAPFLQNFLTKPLMSVWPSGQMLYTGLADGVLIQFSLATLVAILVTIPVLLWHIWAFIAPGLHNKEKKFILPILFLSPILFLTGAAFAFYILFPVVFKFFVEINQSASVPSVLLPAVKDYLSFSIGLLKIFGIAFQMPLILVLLNRLSILQRSRVVKFRRYAMVFIFVISAILTPPDIVSQILLALPMLVLFEISILFMKKDA
ncbi:MAG: twin-arginine translocase subunit TatC [Alphaproteobacteria bacterium]|nr:twin-arginine translocase subunit TatC [Alphaproteobacteria bacterium]MBN2675548.1 twin-arginine translocase subunit TatC [Alphaproteobacteria bacterium]